MRTEIDGPLDPGIAPVVQLLRARGFETVGSCQGGDGHANRTPFVSILPRSQDGLRPYEEMDDLMQVIHEEGLGGWLDALSIFVEWWTCDVVKRWAEDGDA